jgi:hypothetical protein
MRQRSAYPLLLISAAAALLIILSAAALKYWVTAPAARTVVAVIPVPAYIALVAATVAYVRRLDGLQQRINLEAMTFAAATTGLLALLGGQLQKAGVLPPINVGFVAAALMILYVVGYFISRRHYL